MLVQKIQSNNFSNPNFKTRILPTDSVKYAVYTARDFIQIPTYREKNRAFVLEFCNSIAKILKNKNAEKVHISVCRGGTPSYVAEYYNDRIMQSKVVLWQGCETNENYKFGIMPYSAEGANTMKTIIEYAKTLKNLQEENLNLQDEELQHYAYKALKKEFDISNTGIKYVL